MKLKQFLISSFIGSGILFAQSTSGQPSCQYSYTLTNRTTETPDGISIISVSGGTARTPQINNRQQQCNSWLVQVAVDGFSASSIELDDSQNAYTTAGGTPLAWNAWQGTVLSGSNPTTSLSTSALISMTGYYPWLSVNLNSSTGTGNIYVTLYGWKTPALLGSVLCQSIDLTSNCNVQSLGSGDATYSNHVLQLPSATGVIAFGTDVGISRCGTNILCIGSSNSQGSGFGTLKFGSLTNATSGTIGFQYAFNNSNFSFGPNLPVCWGSTNQTNCDTGFSRDSAGVVDIGNGTLADQSGTVKAAQIYAISQHSTSGQRYVCITTAGQLVSSASACSGT